jgi:hypothetical protein
MIQDFLVVSLNSTSLFYVYTLRRHQGKKQTSDLSTPRNWQNSSALPIGIKLGCVSHFLQVIGDMFKAVAQSIIVLLFAFLHSIGVSFSIVL